jgi:hypothetical protein
MEESKKFYRALFQKKDIPDDLSQCLKNDWMKFSKKETNFNLGKEITQQELDNVFSYFAPYKAAGENEMQAMIFKNLLADYMKDEDTLAD